MNNTPIQNFTVTFEQDEQDIPLTNNCFRITGSLQELSGHNILFHIAANGMDTRNYQVQIDNEAKNFSISEPLFGISNIPLPPLRIEQWTALESYIVLHNGIMIILRINGSTDQNTLATTFEFRFREITFP